MRKLSLYVGDKGRPFASLLKVFPQSQKTDGVQANPGFSRNSSETFRLSISY
jgi:hypothetical protein